MDPVTDTLSALPVNASNEQIITTINQLVEAHNYEVGAFRVMIEGLRPDEFACDSCPDGDCDDCPAT